MRSRPVNIHVGRVVVAGPLFSRREQAQFHSALERELTTLLRERPLRPVRNAAFRSVASQGPSRTGARPAAFAAELAGSIYDTLRKLK